MDVLSQDSTLALYPYPLDVKVPDESRIREYFEVIPTISERVKPCPHYASVSVGYNIPNVEHAILEHLYIPDEYKILPDGTMADNPIVLKGISVEELVDRSLILTGNVDEEDTVDSKTSWIPGGRITMEDTELGEVGIKGIKVKARRYMTTHTGVTDANGNFTCDGTFTNSAKYSYAYKVYHFQIRKGGMFSTAGYNAGKLQKGNWIVCHKKSEDRLQNYYSTIFRACHRYYHEDVLGLRRPPHNGTFNTQLKIRAYNIIHPVYYGYANVYEHFTLGSFIHIYNPTRNSDEIYGATIHELAHTSHWNMSSGGDYKNAQRIVKESWASGVEWALTTTLYPDYVPEYFDNYTRIVQDMVGGYEFFDVKECCGDQRHGPVNGYTMVQIEDALQGQRTWESWRDNIIEKYDNPTERNLPCLFEIRYFEISE